MVCLLKCYGRLNPERGAYLLARLGVTFGLIQGLNAKLIADYNVSDLHYLRIRSYLGFGQLIVNIVLIIGIVKKNIYLFLPWLVIYFSAIVSSFYSYVGVLSDEELLNHNFTYGLTIFVLVLTVFDIYTWFCVLGLFLKHFKDRLDSAKFHDCIEIPDNFNPTVPMTATSNP